MRLVERRKIITDCGDGVWYVHCISADFDFSKPDAARLDEVFNLRNKLMSAYPEYMIEWAPFPPSSSEFRGDCLVVADTPVMNLVIKQKRSDKPTYESLVNALKICKAMCEKLSIRVLAMPAIACVDDSLYWSKVKPIIKDVFSNMNIDITVCLPPRKKGRPPHEPEEEDYVE